MKRLIHSKGQPKATEPAPPRLSMFHRFMALGLAGTIGGASASDLKAPRDNTIMAEKQVESGRQQGAALVETQQLESMAAYAASTFKSYILTGDEKMHGEVRRVFSERFKNAPVADNAIFMDRFFRDMKAVFMEPEVKPLVQAFEKDQGRAFGFGPKNPATYEEFIDRIHNIRRAIGQNEKYGRIVAKYGENVTAYLYGTRPAEQARQCVESLREFMLSGEGASGDRFVKILDANTSAAFDDHLGKNFVELIMKDPVLGPVAQQYELANREIESKEFAEAVRLVYAAAAGGSPESVEGLRRKYGAGFVDPLLTIVARGTAKRAIHLLTDALENGSRESIDEYMRIRGSKLATVVNGRVQMAALNENDVFIGDYAALYELYIQKNTSLIATERSYSQGCLAMALRDIAAELAKEKPDTARLEADYGKALVGVVRTNIGAPWLCRSPAEIDAEIDRRAKLGDQAAIMFRRKNLPAGDIVTIYSTLVQLRATGKAGMTEQALIAKYKGEPVSYIKKNLESLSWLLRPEEGIGQELGTRKDALTAQLISTPGTGVSSAVLASALNDIYAELAKQKPDRARLEKAYGADLVKYVSDRRKTLGWLRGSPAEIERILAMPDESAASFPGAADFAVRIYNYGAPTFISAIAKAREAIKAGGIARADAEDALGAEFVRSVVPPTAALAGAVPVLTDVNKMRMEADRRFASNEAAFNTMEAQLDWSIFDAVRPQLRAHLAKMRKENQEIRDIAMATLSRSVLDDCMKRQLGLEKGMLKPDEMRKAAEYAFVVIHMAETGTDVHGTSAAGTVLEMAQVREFLQWYGQIEDPAKKELIGKVIGAVIRTDHPPLYAFIGAQNDRVLFNELAAVYKAVKMGDEEGRQAAIRRHGDKLVLKVTEHLDALKGIERADATSLSDITDEKSARAINEIRRIFISQDALLKEDLQAVYDVLSRPPEAAAKTKEREAYDRQVAALRIAYGADFVDTVQANIRKIELKAGYVDAADPAFMEQLNQEWEKGPGPNRANFMDNFIYVANNIPVVYNELSKVMVFANVTDRLGTDFSQAVHLYRQRFGKDDYLFNLYINMGLLTEQLPALAGRYGVMDLPDEVKAALKKAADDKAAGRAVTPLKPEQFAAFLSTEQGRQLITGGRNFYDNLETGYLAERQRDGTTTDAGEFSDQEIKNLRNRLNIVDALYLGLAMQKVGGGSMAFGSMAARALMNSLIMIENRDPYLAGPYLLQVVPAMVKVCGDEKTLVGAMAAFNAIFSQRYAAGMQGVAYSDMLNRQYFLSVFASIERDLPRVTATFGHTELQDELRRVPEARMDENYLSQHYYSYRPNFFQAEEMDRLPTFYGQGTMPLRLLPGPSTSAGPRLAIPGGVTMNSDAMGLFTGMYDQLNPPGAQMFNMSVPAKYRIGGIGAATVIRRITEAFGPMPVKYQDYRLGASAEAAAYAEGLESGGTRVGVGALGMRRTPTGGTLAGAKYEQGVTEAEEGGVKTTTTKREAELTMQAARVPGAILPFAVLTREGTGMHRGMFGFHYEGTGLETKAPEAGGLGTTTRKAEVAAEYGGVLDMYSRIAKENATDMLVYMGGEHLPKLTGDAPAAAPYPNVETILQNADDAVSTDDNIMQNNRDGRAEILKRCLTLYRQNAGDYNSNTDAALGDRQTLMNIITRLTGQAGSAYSAADAQSDSRTIAALEGNIGAIRDANRDYAYQQERGDLKSRLCFVTREGNVYNLAYGAHTETELMNYFFAGTNRQEMLASLKFLGKNMFSNLSAAGGFDGAAFGITLPHGGGEAFSGLAFGNIVRDMADMEPTAVQEAVGVATTRMLASGYHRDIYAALYRGDQVLETDPANKDKVTGGEWTNGTGEILWRRMAVAPAPYQFEIRGVGGAPLTIAGQVKVENYPKPGVAVSRGGTAGYSEIDLMKDYRSVSAEADNIFATTKNALINVYKWKEQEAGDMGYLLSATYLYSQLEGWTSSTGAPEPKKPDPNYATLLAMYWAQRQGMLVGVQRAPGFTDMFNKIDNAMLEIQNNPADEDRIVGNLVSDLQGAMAKDIWRFALGYGYDGERNKMYVVSSGEVTGDAASYANLYALYMLGRPSKWYADILAHAYEYAPLVVAETDTGGYEVRTANTSPFMDLWGGTGLLKLPRLELHEYTKQVYVPAPQGVTGTLLTGEEMGKLFEARKDDIIEAATGIPITRMHAEMERRKARGELVPEEFFDATRYDVLVASKLKASGTKDDRFYVLMSPLGAKAESQGSFIIGNKDDYADWLKNGHVVGVDIVEVGVRKEPDGDYLMEFHADRKLHALVGEKLLGGITVPLGEVYGEQGAGGWNVGALLHLLQDHRADLLGGVLYGVRQYGPEEWSQWTVTLSGRYQTLNTASMSDMHYGYLFFNTVKKEIVLASKDVFSSPDELKEVTGYEDLTEFRRVTGGAGWTWARADLIAGDRLNLNLFLEAGADTRNVYLDEGKDAFVFRTGFGVDWGRRGSGDYSIAFAGGKGSFPAITGEVARPENLRGWAGDAMNSPGHWWLMLYYGMKF